MENAYAITDAQKQFLEGFRCERLKDDDANETLISSFESEKGRFLVEKLQKTGWKEDHSGSTAYYVVKNARGEIVLFFSLKCGVLFNTNQVNSCLRGEYASVWEELLTREEAANPALQKVFSQNPMDVLVYVGDTESLDCLQRLVDVLGLQRTTRVQRSVTNVMKTIAKTEIDMKFERNRNIIRVPNTYSAVELVEFCRDDNTSACWDKQLMGRSLGQTMFWAFVAPKILEVNDLIGSEYVFLFAADQDVEPFSSKIGELTKFYRRLHFDFVHDLGTAKPNYDCGCLFMCQRTRSNDGKAGLDTYLDQFFARFNENPNAPDYT